MPYSILFALILSTAFADELETIEVKGLKDVSTFNFSTPETVGPTKLSSEGALASTQIEKTSGVVATQNGGPGGRVTYFMRGTESRHLAFTLDGLKLNDPSNTDRQFDAAFLTTPFLKEITVHKGPQAVLFGSDSMGGLVEMKTRKGENAPETRLSFNAGSFASIDGSVSKDWGSNSSSGTVTAITLHTDGISRLNKKRFKATERDGADISQMMSSSTHNWAEKIHTEFLGSVLRGKNELDGSSDDNLYDESQNDQYIFQQRTFVEISKAQVLSVRNGFNRHHRAIDTLSVGKEESYGGQLYQDEVVYRSDRQDLKLLMGIASEREEFSQSPEDFDLQSLFVQMAKDFGRFGVQAGTRLEQHSQYGSFQTGSGGVYFKEHSRKYTLQYSQGYKAPSLYQLYGPVLFGSPVGNPDLDPEINHSVEASLLDKRDSFEGELTLFQNRLNNLITYTTANGYVNQREFIAEGIEVAGKYLEQRYSLAGSYLHQNFRKEEGTVLRRPGNIVKIEVAYFPIETMELSATSRWFSSRMDVDENGDDVKLNPYEVIDLGYKITFEKSDYGIRLMNILNREYEDLYGYSVTPRSIFFHAGFTL